MLQSLRRLSTANRHEFTVDRVDPGVGWVVRTGTTDLADLVGDLADAPRVASRPFLRS